MWSLFVFHRTLQKPAKRARETREQSSLYLLGRLVYLLESCLQGHEHLQLLVQARGLLPDESSDPCHRLRPESRPVIPLVSCVAHVAT